MWSSRDISLVILTAVVVYIFTFFIFQTAGIVTGIVGANYIFTFGMAIMVSLTFLLFEGRRWRFFAHNILVALLSLPTTLGGPPYDIIPRLVLILAGFPVDLVANSLYKVFKNNNRMVWWSIVSSLLFFLVLPFLQGLFFPLFLPPQVVENFSNIVILMIPWIIGGSIVGGYLGYQVYRRVTPSV